MSRLLFVSFQQAVRSITLAILPIAFIALLVWATAGSSNGNTADPLRAALWLFLAAHHVPLQLSLSNQSISGFLSFLPLGALVLPYWTAKSGYNRLVEILGAPDAKTKRLYILDYALCYSVVAYLIALPTMGSTVYSPFYIAIPIVFLVSAIFTYLVSGVLPTRSTKMPWQHALRATGISFIAQVGIASFLLAISLIVHFSTVIKLTQVIEPGIIGGIAFLLIQILYLPNAAIATLGYISGAGLTLGNGTTLSPLIHKLNEIPALPLLGGLPVSANYWLLILALLPIASGVLLSRYAVRTFLDSVEVKRFLVSAHVFLFLMTLLLALLSGGELLSSNLRFVGAIWWLMPIVITLESALGVGLSIASSIGISRWKASRVNA